MSYQATLRVIDPEGGRPSAAQVAAVAARLTWLGFEVVYVGRLAVTIQADAARFERFLGVPPPGPEGYSLPLHALDAELKPAVNRVEAYPAVASL